MDCNDVVKVDVPVLRSRVIESLLMVLTCAVDLGVGQTIGDIASPSYLDIQILLKFAISFIISRQILFVNWADVHDSFKGQY